MKRVKIYFYHILNENISTTIALDCCDLKVAYRSEVVLVSALRYKYYQNQTGLKCVFLSIFGPK